LLLDLCLEKKSLLFNGGSQQINGREGETATLLSTAFGELVVVWRRFRPTSSQSLGVSR